LAVYSLFYFCVFLFLSFLPSLQIWILIIKIFFLYFLFLFSLSSK
jgi:hypothetical protein